MSSKAAKKESATAMKVPTKPKVTVKTGPVKASAKPKAAASGKKKANPKNAAKNAEAAVKKKAEHQRYGEALATAAERGLVTIFDELTTSTAQDKWAAAVGLHILETINMIQQSEIRETGDYNPFPSKTFLLLEDKVSASGKKKAPVKNGKPESSSASKKKAPLKRGSKPTVDEQEDEQDQEDEFDDNPEPEKTPEKDENEHSEESKEERKKNITTFTRDAKNYLGFIVMRFVDDYFSSPGGKNIKGRDEFVNFTYTGITKDILSHVSRAIVTTVKRLEPLVSDLPDRGVPDELNKLVGAHLQDRSSTVKFMGEFLSIYLKLIGYTIAQQLWVSRKTINQQALEAVVRLLDMGNHEMLVTNKVANDNEPDRGLSCGFYRDVRIFSDLVIPKAPKKPKAPGSKGKGKDKKNSKSSKSKTKEAEEEDAEDAEDAEEEADEEAEEEEAEEEADGDANKEEADGDANKEEAEEADEDANKEEADEDANKEDVPVQDTKSEARSKTESKTKSKPADNLDDEESAVEPEPEPEPKPKAKALKKLKPKA